MLPKSVQNVIEHFQRLPGVGVKSASRMAYHFLKKGSDATTQFATDLEVMAGAIKNCTKCFIYTDKEVCDQCESSQRNKAILCVVEDSLDVYSLEEAGSFDGKYFVLGGVISPADGISPEMIRIEGLARRVQEIMTDQDQLELLIALSPTLEGEATTNYIQQYFDKYVTPKLASGSDSLSFSKLAMGLPTGADLEFADKLTISRAIEGRIKV